MKAHQARKRFGQNFLQDAEVIRHIVSAIAAKPDQHLVEIGPGLGALTEPLLRATEGTLDAVELDRDLAPILRTKFFNYPNFHVHQQDALKFDFRSLAPPGEKIRVVGNLPYNISTPLLFHLLATRECIEDMHFMLQYEVAERLSAGPNNGAYGRLGIMVQYSCRVETLFTVPPHAFSPQPKVQSAIVRLEPYHSPPIAVKVFEHFELVVKTAFSQRRKTLANNLKPLITGDRLSAIGIDPARRAETLSLEEFAAISDNLPEPLDRRPEK